MGARRISVFDPANVRFAGVTHSFAPMPPPLHPGKLTMSASSRFLLCFGAGAALSVIDVPAAQAVMCTNGLCCVASVADLNSAIAQANNGAKGSVWDIRMNAGTYQLTSNLLFDPPDGQDYKDFSLSGSWNPQCNAQSWPPSTVLRGTASTAATVGTKIHLSGNNKRFAVDSIRFEDFGFFDVNDVGCGWFDNCPGTDVISIHHNEFRNLEQVSVVAFDAHTVEFWQNLVVDFTQRHPGAVENAPADFAVLSDAAPYIAFNTFANLHCAGAWPAVDFEVHQDVVFQHNIVQSTGCSYDIGVDVDSPLAPIAPWSNLFSSNDSHYTGSLSAQGNVLSSDPGFADPANVNYRLRNYRLVNGSDAVNAGQTVPGAILNGLPPAGYDLDHKGRPVASRYDIGAYESSFDDAGVDAIYVKNSNNGGTDSLRAAIQKSNATAGIQTIRFQIPGACPRVILLDAPLDDITDAVFIDGTSQAGSSMNTLEVGSDAQICVWLAPSQAGVTHALQVPSAAADSVKLAVAGLAFGSALAPFSTAAVALRGGSYHQIIGSAFGGIAPTSGDSLGTIAHGILLTGTAKSAFIGGESWSWRNYFGKLGGHAIIVSGNGTNSHQIVDNYIGVTPNGLSAQGNQGDGISATGGGNLRIADNTIDANQRGIYLSGLAAQNDVVTGNRIGVNAAGYGVAQHANDIGIELAGGAYHNTIGYAPGVDIPTGHFSNDVRNNNTAGIHLSDTASTYNVIRGNRVEANGRSGSGLGIDIGTLGLLPNDANDADSGANGLQNHPLLSGSAPNANAQLRTTTGILHGAPNSDVRLDFYRSPTCPKGDTGPNAETYVGAFTFNTGPSGTVRFQAFVSSSGAPDYLAATATLLAGSINFGSTSELAPCLDEDTLFRDSLEL